MWFRVILYTKKNSIIKHSKYPLIFNLIDSLSVFFIISTVNNVNINIVTPIIIVYSPIIFLVKFEIVGIIAIYLVGEKNKSIMTNIGKIY